MNRSRILTILLALAVFALGLLIFNEAGRPMRLDEPTLDRWMNAICQRDYATAYSLSFITADTTRADFDEMAQRFVMEQGFAIDCYAEVVVHVGRYTVIPDALREQVSAARYYPEVDVYSEAERRQTVGMRVVQMKSDQSWRVLPPFLSPAQDDLVPANQTASLVTNEGNSISFIRVTDEATVISGQTGLYIGVPIEIETLSWPLTLYRIRLYGDNKPLQRMAYPDALPIQYQDGYIPSEDSYLGQNMLINGKVWFQTAELPQSLTMAMMGSAAYANDGPMTYFSVPVPQLEESASVAFNPFVGAEVVSADEQAWIFEVAIDTHDMDQDNLALGCSAFVLQLSESWIAPTNCDFKPDPWTLRLVPDENVVTTISFYVGDMQDQDVLRLTYRQTDGNALTRFDLWEPE